ncbi:MAG: hypothetical protein IT342_26685 [Candidatus Melainabacteria bacterium]|nr:hypothetical protein [Candidatus Melainabacteria bacterium]
MADVKRPAEQTENSNIQRTPEAAAISGVIGGQTNQEVHGQASAVAHANDRTLSEPDLIAMEEGETLQAYKARVAQIQANRFGFNDSQDETNEQDAAKVSEKPAKQAVEPMPSLSPILSEGPYNSTVKLNVQITNVPEVSEGVKPEELLQYSDTTFEAGAQTVRPIENWLATPNAITDSLLQIGPALDNAVNYYANTSANQVATDAQAAVDYVGQVLGGTLDYALTPDERAKAAGTMMPMFFLEGNVNEPIHPETAQQLGLKDLSEAELTSVGIRRVVQDATDLHMPEIPSHLKHIELQPATAELLSSAP